MEHKENLSLKTDLCYVQRGDTQCNEILKKILTENSNKFFGVGPLFQSRSIKGETNKILI